MDKPSVVNHPEKEYIELTRKGETVYLSYKTDVHRAFTFLKLKGLGLTKEDIIACGSWDGVAAKLEERLTTKKPWMAIMEDRTGPPKKNKSWS